MPVIVSVGDHICLQSRKFLNSFLTQDDHFQGVLKIFEIAGIFGSYYNQNSKQNSNQNSKHNQSPPIHLRDSHLRLNQRWAFSQQIQILYRIYNRIHNRIWLSHLTLTFSWVLTKILFRFFSSSSLFFSARYRMFREFSWKNYHSETAKILV